MNGKTERFNLFRSVILDTSGYIHRRTHWTHWTCFSECGYCSLWTIKQNIRHSKMSIARLCYTIEDMDGQNQSKSAQPITRQKSLLFSVEQDIAKLLLTKLEHFDITFERASQIAKFILAHLPENLTNEQLMQIIPSLDDDFTELAGVVHKYMNEYEEKYKDQLTHEIEDLMKHHHFEEASRLAKEYFEKKLR